MNNSPQTFERYLALDIHKHYVVVGGVNAEQTIVLPPRRLNWGEWALWMPKCLHATDAVVREATTNAWQFYDQVAPRVGRTVVAHPGLVKMIASARVKTDKRDVLHLAKLLAANMIPEVWVPPRRSANCVRCCRIDSVSSKCGPHLHWRNRRCQCDAQSP